MLMKKLNFACLLDLVSEIKKNAKPITFILVLAFVYCCTPKLAPPVTDADVQRGKVFWTDCSMERLNAARTLYTNKCGTCHSLKKTNSRDEAQWRKIIPPMAKKAKLSVEEESLILNYVLTMCEAKK
jgi:hypothetical protein